MKYPNNKKINKPQFQFQSSTQVQACLLCNNPAWNLNSRATTWKLCSIRRNSSGWWCQTALQEVGDLSLWVLWASTEMNLRFGYRVMVGVNVGVTVRWGSSEKLPPPEYSHSPPVLWPGFYRINLVSNTQIITASKKYITFYFMPWTTRKVSQCTSFWQYES